MKRPTCTWTDGRWLQPDGTTCNETHCAIEGCDRHRYRRSRICSMHLARKKRTGTYATQAPHVPEQCAADGCSRVAKSKGYCGKHYDRLRRYGDANASPVLIRDDPERRFWSHVERGPECWTWTLTLTYDGYGIFGVGRRRTGAHRWALAFSGVDVPDDMQVDHLCRNRACVRPDHLEVVTPAENTRRIGRGPTT